MKYSELFGEDLPRLEITGKWVSQAKVDGDNFKVICKNATDKLGSDRIIQLINRHDNNYTAQFPEIIAGLGVKKHINCVLNGEIAYWNEEKQIYDFNRFRGRQGLQKDREIMRRRLKYPCKLYVFDLIEYNGVNMVNNPNYPFSRRYGLLKGIVINNNVTTLLPIRTDLMAHFREECKANREGIVVKNLNNIYSDTRTKSMHKVKNWHFSNIKFDSGEINNAGITLTNNQGDRVLCAGKQAELVKAMLVQYNEAECIIRHLQDRTENGKLREGTFKELINGKIR